MKRFFGFMGLVAISISLCFTSCDMLSGDNDTEESLSTTIDLSTVTSDITVQDGYTLTGELKSNAKISIADKATVTLDGVTIGSTDSDNNSRAVLKRAADSDSNDWAGITCEGSATLVLKESSENIITGFSSNPGIFVAENMALTIKGKGSLKATGGEGAAGIGGGANEDAGNIVIISGIITATGGEGAAGIGSGKGGSVGSISIDFSVTLTVEAGEGANSIGAGEGGECGTVTTGCTISEDGTVSGGTEGAITESTYSSGTGNTDSDNSGTGNTGNNGTGDSGTGNTDSDNSGTGNTGNNGTGDSGNGNTDTDNTETTTYSITVSTITGGTVTASATSAAAGTVITLTATANTGYEFGSYSVTYASGNAITVTNGTFTMPASNVTVSATFVKKTTVNGITVVFNSDMELIKKVTETGITYTVPDGYRSCMWKIDNQRVVSYCETVAGFSLSEDEKTLTITKDSLIESKVYDGYVSGVRESDNRAYTASFQVIKE